MSIFDRIYSRAQWGARHRAGFGSRSGNYPLSECWTHHSVTAHLSASATVAQEMAQMRILERIGQQRFGGGISYSFVIFPSGRIYMGLGASRIGAHTGGRNSISLGVVFAGNYENSRPTSAAESTYAELLQGLRRIGVLRSARTNGGHRDAPNHSWNACPGKHLHARLPAINRIASGSTSSGSSGSSGSSTAASNLARSKRMTSWPGRALPVRDFPSGTYWLRNSDSWRSPIVPNRYRHALVVALGEAGYPYSERTAQGAWAQIRRWLRGQHGYNTATSRRATARDFQRYLTRQGVYTGAIDGYLGPQSIWAITTWLNRIRGAYR